MASRNSGLSELVSAMDAVELAIRTVTDRLPIDDLFDMCTNAAAGATGNVLNGLLSEDGVQR